MTFAGTEFTESGLVNGDTVMGVTLTSAGTGGRHRWPGSPYAITPSGAVGTGLANYTISYVNGGLAVERGRVDHHGGEHEQDVRPNSDLCRN